MKKGKKILDFVLNYFLITVASAVYAVGFCWFYLPNGISVGGFTGASQIINYLLPVVPIGVMTIIINIPFFIIGTRLQGIKLLISSLYCMTLCSVFVDIVSRVHTFEPMDDHLLAAVFGGVCVGIACGIQMKVGTTNGGSELLAKILKYKFRHVSVGKLCFVVDIAVIVIYAIVFKSLESALYGIISMYIFSVAVDFVVYGGTHAKMAYIISSESERIRKMLLEMDFGITTIDSKGGLSGEKREMIMCVVKLRQISAIKAAVSEIDPSAFVIVCEAHEVLGQGFSTYSPDEL